MKIEVHRSNGINLKMFLDHLGFISVWNKVNEDFDELQVLPDEREELLINIKNELEKTGYLPYHYLLTPENKGLSYQGQDVEFQGAATQIVDLKNISGSFRLILFEDGRNNYVWKTYSEKEILPQMYQAKGQVTCMLTGAKGENLILFNCGKGGRVKELK